MTTDPTNAEIQPCPFGCKEDLMFYAARDVRDGFDHGFTIQCPGCGIEMHDEYREQVVQTWNTRLRSDPPVETLSQKQAREVMNPQSNSITSGQGGQAYNASTPSVRARALEEAAKVAEDFDSEGMLEGSEGWHIAQAIRALGKELS